MSTAHTKVFTNNRSQAVRLPKSVALPESIREVDIIALGNKRLIVPAGESWDSGFDGARISDDFMLDRDQPADQLRENL